MPLPLTRQIRRQIGRAIDKMFRRSTIDAGGTGRRWSTPGLRAPAREILTRRALAGSRAADFSMNSPYGASAAHVWETDLIADGPAMRPRIKDMTKRLEISAAWGEFWDRSDADGLSDLGGFLRRLARSEFIFGEAFVHMSVDADMGELRLRLWSPEQIDPSLTVDKGNGIRIVAGIEVAANGKRLAYHVRENADIPFASPYGTRRVPAEDVLHIFEPLFPGQMRGISRLTPVATRLGEVDKLEDALLAKANTAALFGGVFYSADAGAGAKLPGQTDHSDVSLEPGAMIFAPPGYSVEFTDPPSTDGAVDFLRSQIRSIAAGVGIPYELIAADLSQVNYSSSRVGLLAYRRRITAIQKTLIVGRFLLPVWKRWLLIEGLAGRIDMATAMTAKAEFVFPGWAQIDPLKETKADAEAIKSRIKSRHEVIGQRGRDPEVVDEEIAQDTLPATGKTKEAA